MKSILFVYVVPMTDEEKYKMYMKFTKDKLVRIIIEKEKHERLNSQINYDIPKETKSKTKFTSLLWNWMLRK